MPEQNITLIAEQEAARLAESDPDRTKALQAIIRANLVTWQRLQANDPKHADWCALDALAARIDVTEPHDSVFRAERLDWCRSIARRLLERDGHHFAGGNPTRVRVLTTFLPRDALTAIYMAKGLDQTAANERAARELSTRRLHTLELLK